MPHDHLRSIPQLEALEFVFPLGKQRVGLRNGLFIGKTGELLNGLDTPPAHEIASHALTSTFENGVRAFFGTDRVRSIVVKGDAGSILISRLRTTSVCVSP